MEFKKGDIVEFKSGLNHFTCTVVMKVIRDNEIRYQVRYPFGSSSEQYWTEQDAKDLKISSYNKLNSKV